MLGPRALWWLLVVVPAACGGAGTATRTPSPRAAPKGQPGLVVLDVAPADAVVLDVRAIRWACTVTHLHGVQTPELVVPVGRAIELHVWTPESPEVAHGIEVSLVGTNVAHPVTKDHPVDIAFRADLPGTYRWKCPTIVAPPSSTATSQNPIKELKAIPANEYDAMLAEMSADTVDGSKLYQKKGCVACHTVDGSPRVGPTWKGIWGSTVTFQDGSSAVVDESYIRESILHPQAHVVRGFPPAMPSFEGQLRPAELDALIGYIQSLK